MIDEPDPPRKIHGLKPTEFEALNEPPRNAAPAAPPAPDPGIVRVHDERIEVRELARIATGTGPVLSTQPAPNRENDVHATLRLNLERDKASGWFDVKPGGIEKRKIRLRKFWITITLVDSTLGLFAWFVGHGNAFMFTFAIAGIGFISARLIWETFFLRTD